MKAWIADLKANCQNSIEKADSACRMMSVFECSDSEWDECRAARDDVKQILKQCCELVELFPHEEEKLCTQARITLIPAERVINKWFNYTTEGQL